MTKDLTFTIDRDLLLDALSNAASVIPDRTPLASYESVEFVTDKKTLRISGTDGNVYMRTKLPIKDTPKHTFALNGRMIHRLISNLDKGDVTFTVGKKQVSIVSGSSKNTLRLAEGELTNPFKDVDITGDATIDAGVLSEAIKTVSVSINTKPIGTVMDCLSWLISNSSVTLSGSNTRMVTTVTEPTKNSNINSAILLSRKYAQYVSKMFTDGDVKILIGKGIIGFDNGKTALCCRTEQGEYPDLTLFIPKEYKGSFVINREGLIKAISRAISISNPANEWTDFGIEVTKDNLHIYSEDATTLSESHEDVPVSHNGEDISVWFNTKYILPLLQSIDSTDVAIMFSVKGPWVTIKPIGMDNIGLYTGVKRRGNAEI